MKKIIIGSLALVAVIVIAVGVLLAVNSGDNSDCDRAGFTEEEFRDDEWAKNMGFTEEEYEQYLEDLKALGDGMADAAYEACLRGEPLEEPSY